jgi:hypothetical protein
MGDFPPYRQTLHEHYLDHAENTVGIEFTSDHDRDPNMSFSTDVYEELIDQMLAFVAARVMQSWKQTGVAARHLRVDIRVELG